MLQYTENIDISFRYPHIESYHIGCLNIDFFIYHCIQFLFLRVNFTFLDSAGNKEFSYDVGKIN